MAEPVRVAPVPIGALLPSAEAVSAAGTEHFVAAPV